MGLNSFLAVALHQNPKIGDPTRRLVDPQPFSLIRNVAKQPAASDASGEER
jgi:hypothetical protein